MLFNVNLIKCPFLFTLFCSVFLLMFDTISNLPFFVSNFHLLNTKTNREKFCDFWTLRICCVFEFAVFELAGMLLYIFYWYFLLKSSKTTSIKIAWFIGVEEIFGIYKPKPVSNKKSSQYHSKPVFCLLNHIIILQIN